MSADCLQRSATFRLDSALVADLAEQQISLPELPSQSLIAIRVTCARAVNMSGLINF